MALFYLLLSLAVGHVQANCYDPSGADANAWRAQWVYQPCWGGRVAMCCRQTDINPDDCRDDGLCYQPTTGKIWRIACTDQSWQSEHCLKLCTLKYGNNGIGPASDEHIIVSQCLDGSFCCGDWEDAEPCCDKKQGVWIVNGQIQNSNPNPEPASSQAPPPPPQTSSEDPEPTIVSSEEPDPPPVSTPASSDDISSTPSISSIPEVSSTSVPSSRSLPRSLPTSITSNSQTSTTTSPTSTTLTSPVSSLPVAQPHNYTPVIAGSVVGGLAGMALIFALFWSFFLRRQSNRHSYAPGGPAPPYPGPNPRVTELAGIARNKPLQPEAGLEPAQGFAPAAPDPRQGTVEMGGNILPASGLEHVQYAPAVPGPREGAVEVRGTILPEPGLEVVRGDGPAALHPMGGPVEVEGNNLPAAELMSGTAQPWARPVPTWTAPHRP
ncbi:hypothetical protein P154DRAFT_625045 [Amniculicola lignicola CBS 123094]|uniref:Mid2 domain-containing protein n=1 Tax=Amniculicola lignicola CBS 123094 TaxID=1392246 RepID=A0A6A5VWQ1_9PLEO|nr:hypothetical protein P154DRAFT_625045 [Amniculicola lignicola CBS 123094]